MTTISLPRGASDISADWLTQALSGALAAGARVREFESTLIGEGAGFLGELARVKLTYEGDAGPAAPNSVVVKLPTQAPAARAMAQGLGLYSREVGFYRDVGADVGVRVPACYHSVLTPDEDFALVLEDIQGRPGDQLASCTLDEAYAVLRALAGLHSHWWESPRLATYSWLAKDDAYLARMAAAYNQALLPFLRDWADTFDPAVVHCCQRLGECFPEFMHGLFSRPQTLAHQDFRLDNVMFGEPGGPDEVVVIDWQGCQHTLATLDLHYFIAGNFPAEVGARHGDEFVRYYHEQLCEGGVRGYSLAEVTQDYARASAFAPVVIVFAITAIDPRNYEGRGRELGERLYGSLADSMLRHEAERFFPR